MRAKIFVRLDGLLESWSVQPAGRVSRFRQCLSDFIAHSGHVTWPVARPPQFWLSSWGSFSQAGRCPLLWCWFGPAFPQRRRSRLSFFSRGRPPSSALSASLV